MPRRCLPEELCRRLFQQLIMAVDYCHRLGIANRDIKARLMGMFQKPTAMLGTRIHVSIAAAARFIGSVGRECRLASP